MSDGRKLNLEFYALKDTSVPDFAAAVEGALGIPVVAKACPLPSFLAVETLTQRLSFSKPKFLFKPGENPLSGIQYA